MNKMVWSRLMVIFFIVSSLFFILPTFENNSVKAFSGAGSGTVADPYQITDADELNETRDDLDANYTLMNDIDLSGCELWNGGEGFEPIGNNSNLFIGNFNGNNHTISNLFINNSSASYVGLFGKVNAGCNISNLGVIDINIVGQLYVGGLIGYVNEYANVTNCHTSGDIDASTMGIAGGLIGKESISNINNSYSSCNVVVNDFAGGLIGESEDSNISNCYASGDVTGNTCIGGLIGENTKSIITDCTASGTVSYITSGGWLIGCCTDCVGGLKINAYNESDGGSITFDISIFNSLGTLVYTNEDCTNTQLVNFTDMSPVAYSVTVIISSDGYNSRTYTATLYENMYITINSYLSTGGNSYLIRIIDEYLYPIDSASVSIKKYVSYTGTWTTVTTFLTDGYGESFVTLLGNIDYKVTVSKTGYTTGVFDWHTDATYYGPGYPKTFKITYNETNINESYDFWDIIDFTGTMYTNGSIKVIYDDSLLGTTDATFKTYERYNFSSNLKSTNITTNDTFVFWVYNINASRTHQIKLFLNHTILGYRTASILISPINYTGVNTTDIEDKIHDVFGDFKLGYVNFFFVFLPAIVILILPGTSHPGLGIVGAGMWMGFTSVFFGYVVVTVALAPFIIALGIILMIVKGGNKL